MKRIFQILITLMVLGSFFSCEPVENRDSLPEINKTASTLNFSVSIDANNKNKVILVNNDSDVIPYWRYTDALGNELGHYNANNVFYHRKSRCKNDSTIECCERCCRES